MGGFQRIVTALKKFSTVSTAHMMNMNLVTNFFFSNWRQEVFI